MEGSKTSIPVGPVSSTSENVAAGLRRSGRERNSIQRYESTAQLAGRGSGSSLKRKRTNVIENNTHEELQYAPKTHAQAAATINNSKGSRKRVTTKKTTQPDDASAKLTTKSRLDSSSRAARDVVDLTGDNDPGTSSKKHKKSKAVKGEEKRLRR